MAKWVYHLVVGAVALEFGMLVLNSLSTKGIPVGEGISALTILGSDRGAGLAILVFLLLIYLFGRRFGPEGRE